MVRWLFEVFSEVIILFVFEYFEYVVWCLMIFYWGLNVIHNLISLVDVNFFSSNLTKNNSPQPTWLATNFDIRGCCLLLLARHEKSIVLVPWMIFLLKLPIFTTVEWFVSKIYRYFCIQMFWLGFCCWSVYFSEDNLFLWFPNLFQPGSTIFFFNSWYSSLSNYWFCFKFFDTPTGSSRFHSPKIWTLPFGFSSFYNIAVVASMRKNLWRARAMHINVALSPRYSARELIIEWFKWFVQGFRKVFKGEQTVIRAELRSGFCI